MDQYYILIHFDGRAIDTPQGVIFRSESQVGVIVNSSITLTELQRVILEELRQSPGSRFSQMICRMPVTVQQGILNCTPFVIRTENELRMMFIFMSRFPEVRIVEMLVMLEGFQPSSGGSAPTPTGRHALVAAPTFVVAETAVDRGLQGSGSVYVRSPTFNEPPIQVEEPVRDGQGLDYSTFMEGMENDEEPFEGPIENDEDEGQDAQVEAVVALTQLGSQTASQSQFQSLCQGGPTPFFSRSLDATS